MTVWCDGRHIAYTHAYNPSTHIPNLEGRGPWGVPRTSDRGHITECTTRLVRPTIRYSYGSNLVVFLRGREAPLPARDRESHYGK